MTKKERPHAEVIKAWAEDADAVVEYRNKSFGQEWIELQDRPTWRDDCEYRIRPAPKKRVEMWQWLMYDATTDSHYLTVHSSIQPVRGYGSIVRRVDSTRIEVEED